MHILIIMIHTKKGFKISTQKSNKQTHTHIQTRDVDTNKQTDKTHTHFQDGRQIRLQLIIYSSRGGKYQQKTQNKKL